MVGSSTVGKSSIVQRLVQGDFSADGTTTCGADFYTFTCPVHGENVKLMIWDTAGQERFRAISKSYFRNAVGAILVFDITNLSSFDDLTSWLSDFQSLASPNAYVLLVGNKVDLEESRQVGAQQIKDFADRHHLEVLETSALRGKNIQEAFTRLAFEVTARVNNGQIIISQMPNKATQPTLFVTEPTKKNKSCC
ncbi:Ras family protein [Histomonas meleagridis]|uniref:Ras family protein n=1 Tax=Histomonas meleagridis TaxID=135588 RepID=UPI00355A3DC7|nr:Ras family protein [Histomonas meleagridis]KAH0798668.1 Ras family protein [Histomonas meleagridis]